MAIYENFVLESKLNELLETKLDSKTLMTVDTDLSESAGMIKKVNAYTYTGTVEDVAEGAGNTQVGSIAVATTPYEVLVSQQTAEYTDEQAMQDDKIVDYILEGSAKEMVNDFNAKFFTEIAKTTLGTTYAKDGALTYEDVVDAIATLDTEDESGLVLIINPAMKADLRKDADFMSAKAGEILFSGEIGSIAGCRVIVSAKCPEGTAYLYKQGAVTAFVKKESEIEQDRNITTRTNTIVTSTL